MYIHMQQCISPTIIHCTYMTGESRELFHLCKVEVKVDRCCMANMKNTVGFWWEPSDHLYNK